MYKKITLFLFITLFGLQLLVQNSETLIQKIFELRQSFIIEKSNSLKTLTLSKKEWLSHKDSKEIKIDNIFYDVKKTTYVNEVVYLTVIEDKNETLIKFITHNLKKQNSKKDKAKLKRNLVFTLNFENGYSNLKPQNFQENNFYSPEKKYLNTTKKTLKPPII